LEVYLNELRLENTLKSHRERLRLSQQVLGQRVGVSRQAILAIEAGRQVPSTSLGLQLAHALGCRFEELFQLIPGGGFEVRIASTGEECVRGIPQGTRVAVGWVEDQWVAHRLSLDGAIAADAVVESARPPGKAIVRPFLTSPQLQNNLLVAGCAPILGALGQRVDERYSDARVTWLPASSRRAMEWLENGLVHVAGIHLSDTQAGEDNASEVLRTFPDRRMLLVNLTRWRQGLVLAAGNPLSIRAVADLLRPGLRIVRREEGAGAHKLITRLMASEGAGDVELTGPFAGGHADVARLVECGAADVGVAIESVALASGLEFLPLVEERFDLVVPLDLASSVPVSRLIDVLDDSRFRKEMEHLPGYDGECSGHVITLGGS
jgi:molybdate-binding protein/DNA-binding XRE family transcriptional regulator